jgi:hypothetical protein
MVAGLRPRWVSSYVLPAMTWGFPVRHSAHGPRLHDRDVKTARAKGLPIKVLLKHALKNSHPGGHCAWDFSLARSSLGLSLPKVFFHGRALED